MHYTQELYKGDTIVSTAVDQLCLKLPKVEFKTIPKRHNQEKLE